jgi:hypothetical protein
MHYVIAWDTVPDDPNPHAFSATGETYETEAAAEAAAEAENAETESHGHEPAGYVIVALPKSEKYTIEIDDVLDSVWLRETLLYGAGVFERRAAKSTRLGNKRLNEARASVLNRYADKLEAVRAEEARRIAIALGVEPS